MIDATYVPWPPPVRPSPPVNHRLEHTVAERAVSCRSRVDPAALTPLPERVEVAGARSWSAPFRRDIRERLNPDVAREVIDGFVLLNDGELARVHAHDGAAPQRLLHSQVVFRCERRDRRLVAVDDDVDRLRTGGKMIGEVFAEARPALRPRLERRSEKQRNNRRDGGAAQVLVRRDSGRRPRG
jgi:hypothetical protein